MTMFTPVLMVSGSCLACHSKITFSPLALPARRLCFVDLVQDVGTAGPGVRSAGQQETGSDDWQGQYYGGNQSGYYSDYPPQGGGREWPSSGQSQQDGNSQYPGYNPRQASDSERNDSGPRAPSR